MKFAKELEDDLVPEWRAKYINYKQGKKRVKAISKALRNASRTPKTPNRPALSTVNSTASIPYTHYDFKARSERKANRGKTPQSLWAEQGQNQANVPANIANMRRLSTTMFTTSPPLGPGEEQQDSSSAEGSDHEEDEEEEEHVESEDEERTPLNRAQSHKVPDDTPPSYGSFSPPPEADPPTNSTNSIQAHGKMPRLALPDPALDPGRQKTQSPPIVPLEQQRSISDSDHVRQLKDADRPETKKRYSHPLMRSIVRKKIEQHQKEAEESSRITQPKPSATERFRKAFRSKVINSPDMPTGQQQAYRELDQRQDDFFDFLDHELNKVEKFYKQKEEEARERLNVLRAQLHEHRDQRTRDMKLQKEGREDEREEGHLADQLFEADIHVHEASKKLQNGEIFKKVFTQDPKIGKTSKAMRNMATPPTSPGTKANDDSRDYTKKKPDKVNERVPYRFAKRRLKLALQEFYRGMELLKSYALLNRTGFRKINKKYDKAVNARPPLRYLNEKVSDAHFVKSTLIDEYLVAVEDLYARYFERGNRKVAVSKLRSKLQAGDHSGSAFRNGLFLAGGIGLGVAGLYNGLTILHDDRIPTIQTTTSYLLQMYAGYLLGLLLFLIFVFDCMVWTRARINYIFVFEYDTRHVLDWRQLAEIPCFFTFLLGLIVWCNFEFGVTHHMYHWWPIILFSLTLIIMFLPFKVLYYHSRKWFAYSNYRLLFAGVFPVEFRDFFLGDMYCSETYFMSQVEIFFCVYRWNWDNPARCNSAHSMLLGFLTTLPAILRFNQSLRRYRDTRNWFPHLANAAKYMGNILYYMMLSLYRIHLHSENKTQFKIAFIVFAAFNAVYSSIWDVFMDWSLGNFFSKNKFLRGHLAYHRKWVYYAAILENTILRHQWIVYAIFTEDAQHSSAASFFVALAEVIRRGIWTLFRVENEHTNNVKRFRASRDIPLPYSLEVSPKINGQEQDTPKARRRKAVSQAGSPGTRRDTAATTGTDYDLERQNTADSGTSTQRRRMSETPALRALQRVGTVIAAAHAQDFEKKRRPEVGNSPDSATMLKGSKKYDSEDDDEDDDNHDIEGSEFDDTDANDPERGEGAQTSSRAQVSGGHEDDVGDAVDTSEEDDAGEGSSGESRERDERSSDTAAHNEHDIADVRRIAQSYNPEAGLRGGASSKKDS